MQKAEAERHKSAAAADASKAATACFEGDGVDDADAFADSMRAKVKSRSAGHSGAAAGPRDGAHEQRIDSGVAMARDNDRQVICCACALIQLVIKTCCICAASCVVHAVPVVVTLG